MMKKAIILTLLAAITTAFAACASTSPSSLSGQKAVFNDKGRLVGYVAK